jgi:hypothetical protein
MTDTVQQEQQAEQSADLSINDLNAMKVIIDVASSRGAFKPAEMELVGKTYTKLANFLEGVAKQQATQPAAANPAPPPGV